MTDHLATAYPQLADKLRKLPLAALPTPVSQHQFEFAGANRTVEVKHDEQTSELYGGNKIRKLEYILQRATDRGAKRIATFGTVGSNHALATAIHARKLGLDCTCFLAHQLATPTVAGTLRMHLKLGTEIINWGGAVDRLSLYRRFIQNRRTWVIPLGGTCWLGVVGFVNAGLELAAQIDAGGLRVPDRIYIASGTMGSVAGLALGLALAGLPTAIHAVRVADNRFARRDVLERLMGKTATLLNRLDSLVPMHLPATTNIVWRDEFFAGGYAAVDNATTTAVRFAASELGITLETTYTGKAMAALLHDMACGTAGAANLFWNTYSSTPLPKSGNGLSQHQNLPKQFKRYFR